MRECRGSEFFFDKHTEGRVREDLVHEFVISPVARQGKGPSRYMLELLRRVFFVMPLRGLRLPLCDDGGSEQKKRAKLRRNLVRDATHLCGVHAATALALATALESFHLAILLHEHRLCVWPPANANAHPRTYTYVRWHAANGT